MSPPGGSIDLLGGDSRASPKDHLHDTYALALWEGSEPRSTEIYFNIGSGFNAQADSARIEASGLADATLVSGSIYRLTIADDGDTIRATDLRLIATGLRNAAGMAFHPTTGDLYLQDNGMERDDDPDEPINADELDMIAADRLGIEVPDFGFPGDYIAYRTGEHIGDGAEQPIVAFQPVLGSEAQGAAEIVFAPTGFPTGFQGGLFVGFHGRFTEAGIANDENPLMFVDPATSAMFDFVPNDAPDVGHLDSLLATQEALFVADLNRLGDLSTSSPDGVIHRIAAVDAP